MVARAARRAREQGLPALGRDWLQLAWEQMGRLDGDGRRQLALALVDCVEGVGTDWLSRVETALQAHGHEAPMLAAAAMVFAERQLWGKARRPLEQTAQADERPAVVRRQALRRLAAMTRQQQRDEEARGYEQRAAMLDA